jgi:hypothetical protein
MNEQERNTHFQGFAKLLYPDLKHWFRELFNANLERNTRRAEQAENMIKLTLTQRAYDLLYHARLETAYGMDLFNVKGWVEEVPDLTEWPEKP